MIKRKVLVSGATGLQGGSVVNALLQNGHDVIGISRNINSDKSKKLIDRGVQMVSVDFMDQNTMIPLMQNVDTVFAMTTPFEGGLEHETEQGISMANAAKEAGVGHFIFNSVANANEHTNIPHFDSKYAVEEHLKSIGLPYTIVAPVYFMDNLFYPYLMEAIKSEGKLRMAMPGDMALQQIAVEDIGKYVAYVVEQRESLLGKRINIAGDQLTGDQAASILSKIIGKKVDYEGFSPEYMREQNADMASMFDWFIDKGYTANLDQLKNQGLMRFEEWAAKQDWSMAS